jgi:hypothetical protein
MATTCKGQSIQDCEEASSGAAKAAYIALRVGRAPDDRSESFPL